MIRFFFLFLALTLISLPVNATEKLDISGFESLPILHEGRIKPLDSFARIMLKTFSGRENINNKNASEWLTESIFDPATAAEKPLFKIFKAKSYGLTENKNNLYSYLNVSETIQNKENTIKSLLETPEKNWTAEQQTLMKLYENFILYTQILRSLTLLLPLDINDQGKTFLDYQEIQKSIDTKVKKIIRRKGTNLKKYTTKEKELAALSYQLRLLEDGGKNNVLFRIIPDEWQSPWAFIQQDSKETKPAEYIDVWKDLARAYHENDKNLWAKTTRKAQTYAPIKKLKIEVVYNQLHLLNFAKIFYVFSFISLILGSFLYRQKLKKIAAISMLSGLTAHIIHIGLRIYILDRPPVGTLYESILFVSLISVAGFLYLSYKQKTSIGILLGSLSGIILLITAQGFSSEDTMGTLVAVLNTNFWLSTHVLCISIGYGVCLITSLMAHYYLVQKILSPQKTDPFKALMKNIKTLAILSLLFTTIGTILGGIWADQSWGRFWGWDPKENGALLIVLWLIWLLHGRLSQHINRDAFIVGCAFLSIIVILAWFGVNLLNVGLHSYGFTTGVAASIGLFCALESLFIGGLYYLGRKREEKTV